MWAELKSAHPGSEQEIQEVLPPGALPFPEGACSSAVDRATSTSICIEYAQCCEEHIWARFGGEL